MYYYFPLNKKNKKLIESTQREIQELYDESTTPNYSYMLSFLDYLLEGKQMPRPLCDQTRVDFRNNPIMDKFFSLLKVGIDDPEIEESLRKQVLEIEFRKKHPGFKANKI